MLQFKKIKVLHTLLSRLLVSYIFIAFLPLFFTSVFLVGTAQDSIQETILERNLEFTERSTRFIDLKIRTAKEILNNQAQHLALDLDDMGIVDVAINTMVQQFDMFDEVSIIDTLGIRRTSTAFDDRGADRMSSNGMVSTILNGLSYQSKVYIGDGRIPKLILAEPLILHTEVIGILAAVVDLRVMWNLVKENALGRQGEAFVFDQEGVYIAHSDAKKVHSEERFSNSVILQRISRGESGQTLYDTETGVEMVAAYAPIGKYGWGAMMQQPTSEAFAPARRMRTSIFQIMLITVLLASLLAFGYSKWIVRPVDHLVRGIDRFSEGDLKHRVQKVSDDEIGTLAEHFNEMADKLIEYQNTIKRTERLETLGKLASVLSHEIRNPLNSMVINMQILKREISKASMNKGRIEKFYGILAAEIKRVDQLVSDFLMVARPPKIEKKKVSLSEVLDDVLTTQAADSLKKGIRLERDYPKDVVAAEVDVDKIKQVFLNLIINAVQAMPGGGRLRVALDEVRPPEAGQHFEKNSEVKVVFSDTGFGIKKEDLSQVFDFYYSTKSDGSGVGLAIVQQIVEMHGGRITVDSEVNSGTTFTIYLPKE